MHSKTGRAPLAASLLATAILALLAVPEPAQAAYSSGTIVDKNDYDFQQAPSVRGAAPAATKFVLPCFVDDDGDGRVGLPEPVYLAVRTGLAETCDEVREKDLRLSPFGALAAGAEVKASDADRSVPLVQLGSAGTPAHAVRQFNDMELAAALRKTDTVYLDLNNLGTTRVDIGDLRLTGFGAMKAGSRVQAGDPDQNLRLDELNGGATKTLYTANMVFEFGKGWYLNADLDAAAGGAVEEGDVRLTNSVPNPFADIPANIGNPGKVVDGLSFSATEVQAGSLFQARIIVKNPTTKVGSALVETRVDGVLVDSRGTPTLAQNEVATLVVTLQAPFSEGQHKVQAGETTAFFDVVAGGIASPTGDAGGTPTEARSPPVIKKQGAPGASGLASLAVLGLALVVMRRFS